MVHCHPFYGRRHRVDVFAASTSDAARLFITHAKSDPRTGIPRLTPSTVFEVVIDGKVHRTRERRSSIGF